MTSTPASPTLRARYDVVVVGGGHNGLTAAAYLARAGLATLVLERLDHTGGAAVSAAAFPGHPVRLSRYSYLVSVMPEALVADLDLDIRLASRSTASYTPTMRGGRPTGLHVHRPESAATAASFRDLTGGDDEYAAWQQFYGEVATLAEVVAPTLMQPLPRERDLRSRISSDIWRDVVEEPLGAAVERRFSDDLVRGLVATDGLIGTFASMRDASLVQNRCFLYHLVGNGTGEWRVPVGGMGAVTDALARTAVRAGAEIVTGADVGGIDTDDDGAEITWRDAAGVHTVQAGYVLSGVAPWTLAGLLGEEPADAKPAGSQLKINLLLRRLPALRSGADPTEAFAGTLHLAESYSEIERAHAEAAAGHLPSRMPGEVYCHSLTDSSILGDAPKGTHTLTYFGLHTPAGLFDGSPAEAAERKQIAVDRALAALQEHLAEPLEDCLYRNEDGTSCIEAKIPQDVEADLAMPGGHIFHGDLAWPWATDSEDLDSPARAWGVATSCARVLLCGSGARRGGAVSGLGGHHAAHALLALR
ncbi:phytoene desaturase family protein [Nocardioides acrostichi]|uniref:Pyridine nucleotide-disulfide oxidoreductase domain-containing protein 2 n=1 Tax=Nocardioides acrostichi TaxID=2784339 RepID=A0A930Y4E9_9ACTN|nr:NAD(P)/FAD-dependent oxidoreductase [Nocardioides acrostichi]MBF4160115.1 NAD(P)/FAD-dependent oxidoreductase [Nocardioides acrostichi]